jgi:hypothetical protein
MPVAYHQPEIKVSRSCRDGVLAALPNLSHHPHALAYRRLFQHLIFTGGVPDDQDRDAIVMDTGTVASLVGRHPRNGAFCALRWLEDFSRDVFPLRIQPYRYTEGRARSVRFDVPEVITTLLRRENLSLETEDLVWLATGLPVTRARAAKLARDQEAAHRLFADGVGEEHPAHALQVYLNAQPQTTIGKLLRRNWPALVEALAAMPETTAHEIRRKVSATRLLVTLRGQARMIYAGGGRTPRLHALGASIHGLPRSLRQVALTGAATLDARACQLAVVEQLWALPTLTALLAAGGSVWDELLGHLDLPADPYKDTCKRGIYTLLFGMGESNHRDLLLHGDDRKTPGFGDEGLVERFLVHPLVAELLHERLRQRARIRKEGGVRDAFGRWLTRDRLNTLRSLPAQQIQSYEVALMTSLVPVLSAERVRVVSFLHDGISVLARDGAEQARIVRRLQQQFAGAADALGIRTTLEEGTA